MWHIRKDYVSERLVIVSPNEKKISKSKKCAYCPGNESMTNPSILSLVAKSGMLQRLQDSEDDYVKNWTVRVFESIIPAVSITTRRES